MIRLQYNSPFYRPTSTISSVQAAISLSVATDKSVVSAPAVGSSTPGSNAERSVRSKPNANVFALGDYLIGDTDDNMITGHPDIRY